MRWSLSVLVLFACDADLPVAPEVVETDACDVLDWDTFAEGYLRSWCLGCHHADLDEAERNGAPIGVDFDTEADALLWGDRILARATGDAPTMPPAGGSSPEEAERLADWLVCQGVE